MYLSGAPLHVITLNLVEKYRRARPEVPISFSAGVDARNFPECAALGFTPITTCTDLLRPGGYGRLPKYLDNLEERMRGLGVSNLGDYIVKACGNGEEAVRRIFDETALRRSLLSSLAAENTDLRGVLEAAGEGERYEALVQSAALLNTPPLVAAATRDRRYSAEANRATPRKIGSKLWLFDCINCDKCVPVCPNDANFAYETGPLRVEYESWRVSAGKAVAVPGGLFEVKKAHQLANFQDFCNDCGNCDTFCPEDGGPFVEKPRFFGSMDAWSKQPGRNGFFVRRQGDMDAAWGRLQGLEYCLEVDRARDRALFTDGVVTVDVLHSRRTAVAAWTRPDAPEDHVLDFAAYLRMALALDGVLDPARANPVNAGYL